MVESVGFEPTEHDATLDELATRCLKPAQPTLRCLVEAVRFELTDPFGSSVFKTGAFSQALPRFLDWSEGWDLNPRLYSFADCSLGPLGHLHVNTLCFFVTMISFLCAMLGYLCH